MTRSEELQHAAPDEFWDRFNAVMGGPDGLMTYRYLGTRASADERGSGLMKIRRDLRNRAGGLMAAPLSIAVADAAGMSSDAGWVVAPLTSAVQIVDAGAGVTSVKYRSSGLHHGRSIGFRRGEVVDADDPGRVLAVTTDTEVKMGDAPPGYSYVDPGEGVPDSPNLPELHEAFGAVRRADGCWQLPELSQRIGSTSGSLHHGPIQIVMEAAAAELAASAAGTNALQIEDWSVMYLRRGKIGPFIVTGEARPGRDRVAVELSLHDQGDGDRRVSSAVAAFAVPR